MTDVFGIVTVLCYLFGAFWMGWLMMSIMWNVCSKTSKFVDSLFN